MDECRRRSAGRRRSGIAGIQNEHACTASADGHIRSAIGSAGDGDQRLVARRGRRIGDLRRDRAGVFDETNTEQDKSGKTVGQGELIDNIIQAPEFDQGSSGYQALIGRDILGDVPPNVEKCEIGIF